MIEDDRHFFKVIDLKQYSYCPRIFYYHTILPEVRPITGKMKEGIIVHHEEDGREKRRQLRTYGINEGERLFHLQIQSKLYLLSGEIDLVIKTRDRLIPVDFKNASKPSDHFQIQLAAYALMLKEQHGDEMKVEHGFLYLIPKREAVEIKFTTKLFQKAKSALTHMGAIAYSQYVPEPTKHRQKCVDCEFRRFCNDVL